MVIFSIELIEDYGQIETANDQMLNLAVYQGKTYGKSCTLVSLILRQIMAQQLKEIADDKTKENTKATS